MIISSHYIPWLFCNLVAIVNTVWSQAAPKLAPLPRDLEFRKGERFQLVCSCREGDPPLTFNWVRDAQPVVESIELAVRRFDEFSSSISVTALREDHAGNYTCIVSNHGGTDSSTVRLRVLVPPTWLRQPYDISVLSGTKVHLNCETSGMPKPNVTWRKNNGFNLQQMEPLSSSHWRTGEDGSLFTSTVNKNDEGFYSCEAANGVGEALRKTVRIEVQVPPTVWTVDSLHTVKKGDSAVMECHVTGDSPLTISWAKANFPLALNREDRIKIEEENGKENTTSSVVIVKTAAEDTGLYFCTAKNTYGKSQTTVRLRIVEKPSPPKDFQIVEIWCRAVRLQWKQPYNGNSPIKSYSIKYKKKGSTSKSTEMLVSDSQSSVIVQDLRPHTTYKFRIVAVNEVEESALSNELELITREEEPEVPPSEIYVKHKDATGFLITWKPPPPEKWNGVPLGFYVGYKRVSHGSTQSIPFTYKVLPLKDTNSIKEENLTSSREYYLGGLQESSSYTVVVHAYNKAGISRPSEQILVKTTYGESPQVPVVSVISKQQSVVNVNIDTNGRDKAPLVQYVLHIREGSGHWLKIPLIANKKTYSIGGLNPGGNYKIYVTSKNKFGDSGPSDVVTFRTDPESISGSVFQYEEEDVAIPFYQRLSFIIPVAVSSTIILVVPMAACCCLQKLSNLPTTRTEGVESRGFSYTASQTSERLARRRTLPSCSNAASSSSNPTQAHYSTLQNYGSVIPPNDPRFSQLSEAAKRASLVILPSKPIEC